MKESPNVHDPSRTFDVLLVDMTADSVIEVS